MTREQIEIDSVFLRCNTIPGFKLILHRYRVSIARAIIVKNWHIKTGMSIIFPILIINEGMNIVIRNRCCFISGICIGEIDLKEYKNADNILGNNLKIKTDSCFLNFENYSLLLLKNSTSGYSWNSPDSIVLDTVLIQNGYISSHYISEIDDKKVFKFSNSDEVILSRNNGITGGVINGRKFEIAGRESTKKGSHLLTEAEIFDFQVGDAFYYEGSEYSHATQNGHSYKMNSEVISKNFLGDSVVYKFKNIREVPAPMGGVNSVTNYTTKTYWNGKHIELKSIPSELKSIYNNPTFSYMAIGEIAFNSTFSNPDVSIGMYHDKSFTTCRQYEDSLVFPSYRLPTLSNYGYFLRNYAKSFGLVVERL